MASLRVLGLSVLAGLSNALSIKVASSGGNATSSMQYGIMFEDINHSGDGGIYAELIQNRAFQHNNIYPAVIAPWTAVGGAELSLKNLSDPLSSALTTSLNVAASDSTSGTVGFSNPGWWGISVKAQTYTGSFYVKGDYSGSFTASLQSYLTNKTYGSVEIESKATSDEWVQHNFTLVPTDAPDVNNTFSLSFDPSGVEGGSLDFNLISLFPPTYKDRPNGLRVDIMESLAKLKPSFLRLPGGNNLEGNHVPHYWRWNETIGLLKDRPGRPGTWGYQNTDGLGLIEYLQWCEDLNMEPILAVWAGLYLDGTVIDNTTLQVYVQDALDELEFLTGGVDTKHGALRASLGYPKPWSIKYVEVGNEDNLSSGGPSYQSYRFTAFYNAIHAKYPDIVIIASTDAYKGSFASGSAEDYHQYTRPDIFTSEFNYFDHFPREYPTLIGEYAIVQRNIPSNTGVDWSLPKDKFPFWIGTVSEAVFLLGAERNTDGIIGASYAPLLQNLNSYEWSPDLISFTADPAQDVESTSFRLIELYANTRMTEVLPTTADGKYSPVFWAAGVNNETGSHVFKAAVYNSTTISNQANVPVNVTFDGVVSGAVGTLTVLTAAEPYSFSEIGRDVVEKTTTAITAEDDGLFSFMLPDLSIALLEVKGAASKRQIKHRVMRNNL